MTPDLRNQLARLREAITAVIGCVDMTDAQFADCLAAIAPAQAWQPIESELIAKLEALVHEWDSRAFYANGRSSYGIELQKVIEQFKAPAPPVSVLPAKDDT